MQIKQEIKNDLTLFGMEVLEIFTRTMQPASYFLAVMIASFTSLFTLGVITFSLFFGMVAREDAPHPAKVIFLAILAIIVLTIVHRVTKVINKRFTKMHDEKDRLFEQLDSEEGRGEAIRQYIRAFRSKK